VTARTLSTVLKRIAQPEADGPTDGELLHRAAGGDFGRIVERHGPMVWAVCRQMLGDGADAEDAFQATFLALFQSASKLRRVRTLGGWLHGAAVNVALKHRRTMARRRKREAIVASKEAKAGAAPWAWGELQSAVHEELQKLTPDLRTVFILCELQGVRPQDAAQQLRWKIGTLTGRLTRARQALVKRLTARGLAPLLAGGAIALGVPSAWAGLPPMLGESAMAAFHATSHCSTQVLSLARAASGGFTMNAKALAVCTLLGSGLLAGFGSTLLSAQSGPGSLPPTTREPGLPPGGLLGGTGLPAGAPVVNDPDRYVETTKPATPLGGTLKRDSSMVEHKLIDTPKTAKELEEIV